jgi:ABC-type transporter Mla MlaB component
VAEKNEASLIGYDPLFWLNQQQSEEKQMLVRTDLSVPEQELPTPECLAEGKAEESDIPVSRFETQPANVSVPLEFSVVLEPAQNIRNVGDLYERLRLALNSQDKIDIDASAVQSVDTAALQLLLVLKQSAIKMQKQVSIDFPSEKFIEAAKALGLSEMLDIDHAAAGFF